MLNERAELNYFLGNPPSWLLRNGIIMVALFFGLLLALSYLIKYPDTVACRVVLTTENPPIRLMAQATGRISELLVKENESVEAGQILAVFENTADWHDVLWLETMLQAPNPQRGLSRSVHAISVKLPLGVGGKSLAKRRCRLPTLAKSASVYRPKYSWTIFHTQNTAFWKAQYSAFPSCHKKTTT